MLGAYKISKEKNMSGHSKWATTHRQKAVVDAKRGAIFTKLANNISIAAKQGGDPNMNPALRTAIDRARSMSMPKDNIERAIKKGTGELGGEQMEELYYEAIGPGGVQMIVKCISDNRNRSAATIRHLFNKNNSSLGAVMWNFEQKGVIMLSREELSAKNKDIDELELSLIDQGVSDVARDEDGMIVYAELADFQKIQDFLQALDLKNESAEIEYVAKEKTALNATDQEKFEKLLEELEDNEEVSAVYSNILD